jgi:DNA-binding MarR family transcriptional regulator
MIASHAEKFNNFDSRLQDQRIDIIELKSRLNELNHSIARFESLFGKIAELEKRSIDSETIPAQKLAVRVARASAPIGSLIEQYHSLAPSTKKIFSLLLQMHVGHKGKWIALSDLRGRIYPGEPSNSTLAAMAKAIRPLYETGFVEKKRDKSFVYVAATKKGRDAAKEAGLNQQAEKFDAVFAKLDDPNELKSDE